MTQKPRNLVAELIQLLRPLWPIALFSTTMGGISGLSVAALLATTNKALHADNGVINGLLLVFAGLCGLTILGEIISDIGNNLVGQKVIAALRKDLCAKILSAPMAQIEQYKEHRLIVALHQDVDTVSNFAFLFSSLAIATAVTLGCLGYLAMLSPKMLLVAVVAMVVGGVVQDRARQIGLRRFAAAREAGDELQKHYRAITEGAKELQMSRPRRARVYGRHLQGAIDTICDLRVRGANVFVSANALASLLFFLVVGLMLMVYNASQFTDKVVISGFVLVLLYMKGPLEEIIGTLPILGRAQVSFQRLAALSAQFSQHASHIPLDDRPGRYQSVEQIELRDVQYVFPTTMGMARFELGPINLHIKRGEVLFIVGENGCGKTTLIKIILGLYRPSHGQVLLDGQPIGDEALDDYRQLFSVVFTDYFLFDELIAADGELSNEVERYLERLEIRHKVSVENETFSTTDLSTGQRKRLALIHAYLERRPVMVFDEWAADQDPTFRRIFYTEIVPDLKQQGKTLIVISHDDRYFDAADRSIRLSAGKIVEEVGPSQVAARALHTVSSPQG